MSKDRWSLRNIYLYLVCLITLIMVIVSAVGLIRGTVELVYPEPGYYYEKPLDGKGESATSDEEWDRQQKAQQAQSRRYAILSLVGSGAMLVIAGPLYIYHWRKIETEHGEKSETEVTSA